MILNKKPKGNIVNIGYLVSFQLFFIGIILNILKNSKIYYISNYINLNIYLILSGLFLFYFGFWRLKQNNFAQKYCPYLFIFILTIFMVNEIFHLFYLEEFKLLLFLIAIILGSWSILFNKEAINTSHIDLEKEKLLRNKKIEEFKAKFVFLQKINIEYKLKIDLKKNPLIGILKVLTIPIIFLIKLFYSFIRWIYIDGITYTFSVLTIFCIGFTIRIWNLGN